MIEINIKNIVELIGKGESETLEFKESFSNAHGGTLLIGVKDSGEICGLQIGSKTLEDIANRIQNATDPRLQPSILTFLIDGKSIIVISVLTAAGVPISVRGRYFRRVGRTNQRMSHEEIMQKMIASTGLSWDSILEPTTTVNDLDFERINRFIFSIKKLGRQPIPEHTTELEFLRKIELIRDGSPTGTERSAVM